MNQEPVCDYFKIAKRDGNPRRSYLIVNPRQAKHVPTRPKVAWSMMAELARIIDAPDSAGLVIAFAETATAIGAIVALELGPNWRFTHSTRARKKDSFQYIDFEESHSHATGHHLAAAALGSEPSKTMVFIDDEYTTGQTLINAAKAIRQALALPNGFVAGSLIDRTTSANRQDLADVGMTALASVTRLEAGSLAHTVADLQGVSASDFRNSAPTYDVWLNLRGVVQDPRFGVVIGQYYDACSIVASSAISAIAGSLKPGSKVAVVGTEECMFPAIVLALAIERDCACEAYCHATTRSPILVSSEPGYPIRNGFSIRSVYDPLRKTFIYNIHEYDALIIVTDALDSTASDGLADLAGVFSIDRHIWTMVVAI